MATISQDISEIPDLYNATIQEILDGLDRCKFTVIQLVSVSLCPETSDLRTLMHIVDICWPH